MALPYKHISYSQINDYVGCRLQYKIKYIDNKQQIRNKLLEYGKFIHDSLEATNKYLQKVKKDNIDIDEIKKIYDEVFRSNKVIMEYDLYEKGWSKIRNYAERTFSSNASIFKIEENIDCELSYKGKTIIIKGRIDRIDEKDDSLIIWDFKSGSLVESKEEISRDLQGDIYSFMISKRYPEFKVRFGKWYIGADIFNEITKDKAKLDWVQDYLIEIWQKMEKETEYPANIDLESDRCFYCPQQCATYKTLLEEQYADKGIKDINHAILVYKQIKRNISLLTKEGDKRKEYLKKVIEANLGEPVPCANGEQMVLVNKTRKQKVCLQYGEEEINSYQQLDFMK